MEKLKTFVIIVFLAAVGWFFIFHWPAHRGYKDHNRDLIASHDSIRRVNNQLPDTIIKSDTITYRDTTVIQKHDTVYYEPVDSMKLYYDTLRNDQIQIWTSSLVDGTMEWNNIGYRMRLKEYREKIIINNKLPVPYPVKPAPLPEKNAFYIIPQVGMSPYGAIYGGGLLYETDDLNYLVNYYRVQKRSFVTAGVAFDLKNINLKL